VDFTEKQYLVRDIVTTAYRLEADVFVDVLKEKVLAKAGQWIVTFKDGRKKLMDNDDFQKRFIQINDHLEDCKDEYSDK
jgi:hypothetical protein